ncbi:MAG: ferritin family protein [Desulfobacter postgatei]|uniref:rhodanese-like domain-containing protein n=1 Tax=Desulfobacter postgatei TaxID=2293 RepID=UPI0023F567C1|nr:rhodanese-like domain-containing protein [Desulfobacter postgatei]MDD4272720.1 ferritin family protein [Desulfobacter postgatei]
MIIDDEFKEISFEAFEHYRAANKEADFIVVDVRQEREYAAGHLPGAKLIPLNTLGNHLSELALDKDLFFYCHSGARSEVAGIMAAESGRDPQKTYNITGGFLSYQGHSLEGFPRLQVFDYQESDDQLLYQAMELEKAAERFYESLLSFTPDENFIAPLEQLSKAEIAHARTIYSYWKKSVENPVPFEELYGSLKGDILENGRPLSDVMTDLYANKKVTWTDVIEMALSIEIQAYDLYRTMADRRGQGEAQDAFLSIAQMEKSHMKLVAKMLGDDTI